MKWASLGLAMAMVAGNAVAADEATRPVVLELFTSQGCSSCPPADALLKALAADPQVLALSFHVHYWDYLGWKDPFASPDNTNRQRAYAQALHESVYTPQLVVDGGKAVVGSNKNAVQAAIDASRKNALRVTVSAMRNGNMLDITVAGAAGLPAASVFAMQFTRAAKTAVSAGENNGRTLESINNVIRITRLGSWQQKEQHYQLPVESIGADGVAVLVQAEPQGRILGAALLKN